MDMSERDEVIVRLMILSETQTPEQITALIGLASDKSWRVGETRPKTTMVEKNNGWVVDSQMPRSSALSCQVTRLLDRLSPFRRQIRKLARYEKTVFSCVVYSDRRPPLVFSKKDIFGIAGLGAALDIDVYLVEL